jgi:alpha-L-arabinofuranosidase
LTNKEKMLLTPTYHVFDMYQPFKSATPFPAIASGPSYDYGGRSLPAVDVSAARSKDGRLYLALVNLDPHRAADIATNLTGTAHGTILTGPTIDTHNTFEAPDTVHPVPFTGSSHEKGVTIQLPAKSIAVLAIE